VIHVLETTAVWFAPSTDGSRNIDVSRETVSLCKKHLAIDSHRVALVLLKVNRLMLWKQYFDITTREQYSSGQR